MTRKMKDSGIEWIGEIPEGWEVSLLKYATRWKSEKGCPDAPVLSLYRDFGVVPKDSRDDNHNVTSLDTSNYKVVDIGDLVINKMKAWQGSMAVSDYRGIVSPAYHVCSITSNKVNKRYLHHLLRNPAYLPEYARLSTGMRIGQWDLGFDDFKNIPFLIPPLDEQEKIADYLDNGCASLDAILDKTRASIEEYKKLKQAVITQAVTKGVRGEREMKDSGVEWIGKIPAEWSICPLKRLAAIQTGCTPSKTSSESFYSSIAGTPWIKPDNLGFSSSIETTAEFLTEEGCSVARILPSNTVYVGCIGSRIGNCGYSLIPCACNQQINALIFNARMYWKYGWYLTIFQEEQYMLLANGNVIQIINSTTQGNISCIVPSISEQKEIVDYLDAKCAEIDRLIAKKEKMVKELESYKKSLIYEVVTGKREV